MNTYKITAYVKITIEIDAPDDDKARNAALEAQLADWTQGEIEISDIQEVTE